MPVVIPSLALAVASVLQLNVLAAESIPGVVVDNKWRFTAVTERLIRIEYDEEQKFVDDPTIAFVRSKPLGVFEKPYTDDAVTVLSTSKVSVRYQSALHPSEGTVSVSSRSDSKIVWRWGDDPEPGNLRGTARTLDSGAETLDLNCHHNVSAKMPNSEMHCTWGLISRKGWAVVNDTGAPVRRDDWYAPSRNSTDVSVFMHGLEYADALKDFFYAAGPPAVPPRYAMGTIFTRWFDFDQDSALSLADEFESHAVPLDAWIFDMNWHTFGPWGAYTWTELGFPQLQEMLNAFQAKQLPIGANVHDHDGIRPQEQTYKEVCKALGRDPGATIPFDLYNKSYTIPVEDIAVRALDTKDGKQGIDFYWIDYQQGESNTFQNTGIPNINPTIVLNELRSTDPKRHGEDRRGLILSRWGGLGNHRYPVGFSGDQQHDWNGLQYLPYFTSTAANVAYNYWSHDTVGGDHDLAADYELSVRWVQTSAWSPVLRFHDKGAGTGNCATSDVCAKVVPWDIPSPFFQAIREATQVRASLVPYMYTAAFSTAENGLALCRPMYYEDPADDALYGLDKQYLFGPDMIISPITQASGPDAKGFNQALGAVEWQIYAPQSSKWVDRLNGELADGKASTLSNVYGIKDVPGLARQGAVIPMRPRLPNAGPQWSKAANPLDALEFRIMPAEAFYVGGTISGSGKVIDDDGLSMGYERGEFSTTVCEYWFNSGTFNVRFNQTGDFKGRPKRTTLRLSFPQLPPLQLVNVMMGSDVTYDHDILGPVITMKSVDLVPHFSVQLRIHPDYSPMVGALGGPLPNFVGLLGRVRRARYAKDALDVINTPYGLQRDKLVSLVLAGTQMSPSFLQGVPKLWDDAVAQVSALLANNTDLTKDARRSKFVAAMMGLKDSSPSLDDEIPKLI